MKNFFIEQMLQRYSYDGRRTIRAPMFSEEVVRNDSPNGEVVPPAGLYTQDLGLQTEGDSLFVENQNNPASEQLDIF